MKKMIKFPSIVQFREVIASINRSYNFVGLDENGEAVYDHTKPKPKLNFHGTVKIHGCFDKDSEVTLANGEQCPISELKPGDFVLSYDIENESFVEKEVTHTYNDTMDKKWVKLFFDDGSFIECTDDHQIYTKNRGWVEAKNLTSQDLFLESSIF